MRSDVTEHLYRTNFIPRRINLSVWTLSSLRSERKKEKKLLSILLRIKRIRRERICEPYKSSRAGRRFAADTRRKSFPAFFPCFLAIDTVPRHYNFGNGRPRPGRSFPQYGSTASGVAREESLRGRQTTSPLLRKWMSG